MVVVATVCPSTVEVAETIGLRTTDSAEAPPSTSTVTNATGWRTSDSAQTMRVGSAALPPMTRPLAGGVETTATHGPAVASTSGDAVGQLASTEAGELEARRSVDGAGAPTDASVAKDAPARRTVAAGG